MNKDSYILELRRHIKGLPKPEIEEAISYYEEYFYEAGVENEEKVIAELGCPKDVAMKILGDYTMKNIESDERPSKKWSKMIWLIVLGIFASPIALPIGIALFFVVLALIISIVAVVISFFAVAIAFLGSGIVTLFMGLPLIISELPSALFFSGVGLVSMAVGVLAFIGTYMLGKAIFKGISILTAKWFNRSVRGGREEQKL